MSPREALALRYEAALRYSPPPCPACGSAAGEDCEPERHARTCAEIVQVDDALLKVEALTPGGVWDGPWTVALSARDVETGRIYRLRMTLPAPDSSYAGQLEKWAALVFEDYSLRAESVRVTA